MKYNTYKYVPKKEIRNAAIFSGICLFTAAALIIISTFISNFKIIYQLSAIVFATLGIQITTRFIITSYVYILDKTDFIVLKISGRKPTQICNVTLETAIGILDKSDKNEKFADAQNESGSVDIRMNFCQNMFSATSYMYVFEYNKKKSAVVFDADENFIKEMKMRIEYAKLQANNPLYDSNDFYET